MKKALTFILAVIVLCSLAACTDDSGSDGGQTLGDTRVSFTVGDSFVTATLYDNSAARDLVARLPLTLSFRDYNATEKIAYIPEGSSALDTSDAPSAHDPAVGDITLYAPWGNLAIFYRDFGRSNGLVPLGKLEVGGAEIFAAQSGEFSVTLELAL